MAGFLDGISSMFSSAPAAPAGSFTSGIGDNGEAVPSQFVPDNSRVISQPTQAPQSIMGMSPDQFSSMAGGIGSALSKKGSWQERMGTFARGLGVAQMAMAANKAKAAGDSAKLSEILKLNPGLAAQISSMSGTSALPLNPENPKVGGI
jgi:hypothetical protein